MTTTSVSVSSLAVNGTRLHVECTAGSQDPIDPMAVVLVNSWGTSTATWGNVRAALLGLGTSLVSYDARGCGRSARLPQAAEPAVDIRTLTDDLVAVCDWLHPRPVLLVGASIGGVVAIEAALRSPAVRGVTVVGGPGHWGTRIPDVLDGFAASLVTDREAGLDELSRGMLGPDADVGLRTWLRADLDGVDPRSAALFLEQQHYDPRPVLAGIAVPVRYVHGELDEVVPVAVAHESAALAGRAGAGVAVVPGAGHLVHVERPDAVAAEIRVLAAAIGTVR